MLSKYIKRKVKKMSPLNGRKYIKAVPSPLSHHPLLSIYVQMFNDDVYATLLFGYLFPSSDVSSKILKDISLPVPFVQLTSILAFA